MESITAIGLTIGLTQLVKNFEISSRWLPVVALVFGVLATMGLAQAYDIPTLLSGIVTGLSSMGLYTGTKVVVSGIGSKEENSGYDC